MGDEPQGGKRILHLGAQGDGVAEDGAFVPFTLPGERVATTGVLAPAPERVAPLCRHFGTCGGCALQHADDGFVAAWKERLVTAALGARGLRGVAVRPVLTVPPGSRRRIALAGRRTKKGVSLGFHAPASDTIVAIEECPVARPRLVATLPALVPLVRAGASRTGVLRLTLTDGPTGVDVAVTGAKLGAKAASDADFLATLAGLAADAGLARLSWNGEVVAMAAAPAQSFGRVRVVPPPGGFLQPTAEGEAALAEAVAEALGPALKPGARVADLFAGSGAFALRLAERADVLAVEGEAAAVAALEAGWRATPGLRRVVARCRDLFERPLEAGDLKGLDGVVLDPPRAGARAQCERLAAHGPGRIAYVSCNPATFARDARTLVDGGYTLAWVQPVDQFRWSPHVELAAAFRRG